MEYVTFNLYFWPVGAMTGIVSTVVGYWVKEIKGLWKSNLSNLKEHQDKDKTVHTCSKI